MNSLDKKFKLIDLSFKVIEMIGWDAFSLKKLSLRENISLTQVMNTLKSKENLLEEYSKMIDFRVERNFDFEEMQRTSIKDNLFELIMLRLEFMQPNKMALKKILFSMKTKPKTAKKISKNVLNSLDFYLQLTNAYDDSFFDLFKKKSILLIYGYVFMIWLEDDSEELSKTMSELDKLLSFSEKLSKNFKNYIPF